MTPEEIGKRFTDNGFSPEDTAKIMSILGQIHQDNTDTNPIPPNTDQQKAALMIALANGAKEVVSIIKEYIKVKYTHNAKAQWIFLILIFMLLLSVVVLAFNDHIDKVGTSTLLASIIGYAIGKYQQKSGNSSND